jgi:hypothetical protein
MCAPAKLTETTDVRSFSPNRDLTPFNVMERITVGPVSMREAMLKRQKDAPFAWTATERLQSSGDLSDAVSYRRSLLTFAINLLFRDRGRL